MSKSVCYIGKPNTSQKARVIPENLVSYMLGNTLKVEYLIMIKEKPPQFCFIYCS